MKGGAMDYTAATLAELVVTLSTELEREEAIARATRLITSFEAMVESRGKVLAAAELLCELPLKRES